MKSPDATGLSDPGVAGTQAIDLGRSLSSETVTVDKSISLSRRATESGQRRALSAERNPSPPQWGCGSVPPRPETGPVSRPSKTNCTSPATGSLAAEQREPPAFSMRPGESGAARLRAGRAESAEIAARRSRAATAPDRRKRPPAGRPGSRAAGDDHREEPRVAVLNTGQRGVSA